MVSRSNKIILGSSDNPYAETLASAVRIFNLDRSTRSKYLRLNCPWCEENTGKPDTQGKLHFYLDDSYSHCMRCGAGANVNRLFARLGLTLPIAITSETESDYFPGLKRELEEKLVGTNSHDRLLLVDPPEIELPFASFPIAKCNERFSSHRRVLARLKEWKIDIPTAAELGWHWCEPMDSFIFPVYNEDDEPIYWSARSFDGTNRSSAPCDFSDYGILGNFYHNLRDVVSVVYLVEGPKDSAALIQEGFWGVHFFGHRPNKIQIARLALLPHTKRLLLDSDVTSSTNKLAEENHWEALYLPSGDPADYAGEMSSLLTTLETQTKCNRTNRLARLRQKLSNKQVHTSKKLL